jgi:hypothetical protein
LGSWAGAPERFTIIYANAKTKTQNEGETEMSKAAGQPSTNTLSRVVALLEEHRIKLDALEHVLKETNPIVHEFYLGTIENLRAKKAAEVNQVLTKRSSRGLPKAR